MLVEMRKRIGIFPRLLGGFACPFLDDEVVEEEEVVPSTHLEIRRRY